MPGLGLMGGVRSRAGETHASFSRLTHDTFGQIRSKLSDGDAIRLTSALMLSKDARDDVSLASMLLDHTPIEKSKAAVGANARVVGAMFERVRSADMPEATWLHHAAASLADPNQRVTLLDEARMRVDARLAALPAGAKPSHDLLEFAGVTLGHSVLHQGNKRVLQICDKMVERVADRSGTDAERTILEFAVASAARQDKVPVERLRILERRLAGLPQSDRLRVFTHWARAAATSRKPMLAKLFDKAAAELRDVDPDQAMPLLESLTTAFERHDAHEILRQPPLAGQFATVLQELSDRVKPRVSQPLNALMRRTAMLETPPRAKVTELALKLESQMRYAAPVEHTQVIRDVAALVRFGGLVSAKRILDSVSAAAYRPIVGHALAAKAGLIDAVAGTGGKNNMLLGKPFNRVFALLSPDDAHEDLALSRADLERIAFRGKPLTSKEGSKFFMRCLTQLAHLLDAEMGEESLPLAGRLAKVVALTEFGRFRSTDMFLREREARPIRETLVRYLARLSQPEMPPLSAAGASEVAQLLAHAVYWPKPEAAMQRGMDLLDRAEKNAELRKQMAVVLAAGSRPGERCDGLDDVYVRRCVDYIVDGLNEDGSEQPCSTETGSAIFRALLEGQSPVSPAGEAMIAEAIDKVLPTLRHASPHELAAVVRSGHKTEPQVRRTLASFVVELPAISSQRSFELQTALLGLGDALPNRHVHAFLDRWTNAPHAERKVYESVYADMVCDSLTDRMTHPRIHPRQRRTESQALSSTVSLLELADLTRYFEQPNFSRVVSTLRARVKDARDNSINESLPEAIDMLRRAILDTSSDARLRILAELLRVADPKPAFRFAAQPVIGHGPAFQISMREQHRFVLGDIARTSLAIPNDERKKIIDAFFYPSYFGSTFRESLLEHARVAGLAPQEADELVKLAQELAARARK